MSEPTTSRRCRVALLPDSHVQPVRDEWPRKPTRRLYGAARWLLETYVDRLAEMGVDAILLLGDTLDPAEKTGMQWLTALIERSEVPVHVIIGNHESYGSYSPEEFHIALGLPAHGNRVIQIRDSRFLMLATPSQDSFRPGAPDYRWLEDTLEGEGGQDLFCCAHFSLLLHPCVVGRRNDGLQVLHAKNEILSLLQRYPNVRSWIAGHKNVPSKREYEGVLHLLSPQLIQAPCAFRIIDVHPDGILSRVHSIEEADLAALSREAYGALYPERHGASEGRDFWWSWC